MVGNIFLAIFIVGIVIWLFRTMWAWNGEDDEIKKVISGCFFGIVILVGIILFILFSIPSCSNSSRDNKYYDEERYFRYHR